MSEHIESVAITPSVVLGADRPVLIAGPCALETPELAWQIAQRLHEITARLALPFIFKASFDKANRTSHRSFRSIGLEAALTVLGDIRATLSVPVLTDIHEVWQVEPVAAVVDVLQIPAFLCRQTDLLQAAGRSGRAVNIKRGQFMAPEDMAYAVEKVTATGNQQIFLTERGSSFGYHNLVVDMRALPTMRRFAPVIFDATHSVQMPGGAGGSSAGQREFVPYLARAAAAVGVDGFFIETHPDPAQARSDGPNMIALDQIEPLMASLLAVWSASHPFVERLP